MLRSKLFILAVVTVLMAEGAWAQRSQTAKKSRYQHSGHKVRGAKAKIACPVFADAKYPIHSLGLKVGDPFAVTYKLYPNERFSLVADAGSAASGLYRTYYREKFDQYAIEEKLASGSAESTWYYAAHRVQSDLVLDVKLLYHLPVPVMSNGFQGYAGVGWEWKRTHLRYDYESISGSNDPASGVPFGSFERELLTMGPEFVLGLEYTYFKIPLAAFMEIEYFTDVQADPGRQRLQGGVGLRYLF